MKEKKLPRGIRNKNPLNIIVLENIHWAGQVIPSPADEKVFCVFKNWYYGWRATLMQLRTYLNRGDCTIERICRKWDPVAYVQYIEYVERLSGVQRWKAIAFEDEKLLFKVICAMCQVENGLDWTPQINPYVWCCLETVYKDLRYGFYVNDSLSFRNDEGHGGEKWVIKDEIYG